MKLRTEEISETGSKLPFDTAGANAANDDDTAVSAGDAISAGDIIGYMGASGFTDESALGVSVYDMPEGKYR